ncbi:MAG: methyltransferase domain-containing protein [Anaerolineae bacterium]|nr:methyltransferase domain-containing protein [Anaerolineae bacterium]
MVSANQENHLGTLAWRSLLRLGFRLLYNELAFTYDAVSAVVSLGQWSAWQRAALPHLDARPGDPVLELAHGTGRLAIDLRRAGYRVTALDLSRAMGRIARRRLGRWGWRPSLVRARAQALPFPAGHFAAAVSTFPTEFIADPLTLGEVFRVLAPGGRLVIVLGGLLTGQDPAARSLELAYRITGQRGPWPVVLEARLAAAGFTAHAYNQMLPRSAVIVCVAEKPRSAS